MPSINTFLHGAKLAFKEFQEQALKNASVQNPIKFVIGNQSGDLDSIVSSISYSYYAHLVESMAKGGVPNENRLLSPIITIPVLNFKHDELDLRKDVVYLFKTLDIQRANLVFIDELAKFENLQAVKSQVGLVLVDHNVIEQNISKYMYNGHNVIGIIDHHKDEEMYMNSNPRIIKPIGSCSTLVSTYWLKKMNILRCDGVDKSAASELSKSLLVNFDELVKFVVSPLLIDTSQLQFKTTQDDVDIFKVYNELISGMTLLDTGKWFKSLKAEKLNIEGLSATEIIKKDYKLYTFKQQELAANLLHAFNGIKRQDTKDMEINIGIASMVKLIEWLKVKNGSEKLNQEIDKFGLDSKVNIVMILSHGSDIQKVYHRELSLKPILGGGANQDKFNSELAKFLTAGLLKTDLGLELQGLSSENELVSFEQHNTSASRKQVAPFVRDVMTGKV